MYVPPLYLRDDAAELRALIRDHGFATLTTVGDDGAPFVTHLPLLHVDNGSEHGVLRGHMARANPQWRHFARGGEVLAVFSGPHAYISPSWYVSAGQVPTWNYAAVHVYGVPRLVEDPVAALAVIAELVERYEGGREAPWRIDSLEPHKVDFLVKMIVAFEIPVARLQGKWKVGQNRKDLDRVAAAQRLAESGTPDDLAVSAWMLATSGGEEPA